VAEAFLYVLFQLRYRVKRRGEEKDNAEALRKRRSAEKI
jgi:hypothetical protein